jgi:hypothetical protein
MQVLILKRFNFIKMNTYKKPGGGIPASSTTKDGGCPGVLTSLRPERSVRQATRFQ